MVGMYLDVLLDFFAGVPLLLADLSEPLAYNTTVVISVHRTVHGHPLFPSTLTGHRASKRDRSPKVLDFEWAVVLSSPPCPAPTTSGRTSSSLRELVWSSILHPAVRYSQPS